MRPCEASTWTRRESEELMARHALARALAGEREEWSQLWLPWMLLPWLIWLMLSLSLAFCM